MKTLDPRRSSLRRHLRWLPLAIGALWVNPVCAVEPATVRVYLVGDSTVSDYKSDQPCRGWGEYLQPYFKESVSVVNKAVGGRSSKSFQTEGRWRDVLQEKPDFVLIQFGHNDSHPAGQSESTTPNGEFRECLFRYVDSARKIGATPILVTPVQTRVFNQQGRLADPLRRYAEAMRSVASERKVALVDLSAWSSRLFEQLGAVKCQELGPTPQDLIHFNELGAKAMAELVVRELRRVEPRLAAELLNPGTLVSHQTATKGTFQ